MTRVMLGLRLAARAGRARMLAVVGCSALGILLLLLCLDFPDVAHNPQLTGSADDRIGFTTLSSIVALPIVILIVTVSRLSSDLRDRRLATLRLIGVPPSSAGVIVMSETGILVFAGGFMGVVLHDLLRHIIWNFALVHGFGRRIPQAQIVRDLVVLALMTLVVSSVSAVPTLRHGTHLLQGARTRPRTRGHIALTALGAFGLVTALVLAILPNGHHKITYSRLPFLGFALVALIIGIVNLTGSTCDLISKKLRNAPSGATLVAAARIKSDRASLGRAFAGLGAAVFASAFGLSVFTVMTTTDQYRSADYVKHHSSAFMATPLTDQEIDLKTALHTLKTSPDALSISAASVISPYGTGDYSTIISLSCAQIRTQALAPVCSDSAPWIAQTTMPNGTYSDGALLAPPGNSVTSTARSVTIDGKTIPLVPAFVGKITPHDSTPDATIRQILGSRTLVIPGSWMRSHDLPINGYFVIQKAGSTLTQNARLQGTYRIVGIADLSDWNQVEDYRHLAYALTGIVMSVGLLTVIVSVLDLLAERRRRVASLRMMGMPTSTLRRAQFFSTLVPMAATLIVTLGAGYLMGRAYLSFAGEAGSTPTAQLAELLGIMLLFGIALAAATTSGLGRPLTANLIRRE